MSKEFKPANHLEATGYNAVMQDISPHDSKDTHLGVAADFERGIKARKEHPKDLVNGMRKAIGAIRSMYQ